MRVKKDHSLPNSLPSPPPLTLPSPPLPFPFPFPLRHDHISVLAHSVVQDQTWTVKTVVGDEQTHGHAVKTVVRELPNDKQSRPSLVNYRMTDRHMDSQDHHW